MAEQMSSIARCDSDPCAGKQCCSNCHFLRAGIDNDGCGCSNCFVNSSGISVGSSNYCIIQKLSKNWWLSLALSFLFSLSTFLLFRCHRFSSTSSLLPAFPSLVLLEETRSHHQQLFHSALKIRQEQESFSQSQLLLPLRQQGQEIKKIQQQQVEQFRVTEEEKGGNGHVVHVKQQVKNQQRHKQRQANRELDDELDEDEDEEVVESSIATIEPDLPFGDINVVVLTDVHSWISGHHGADELYDADYGDILSFYEQLKTYCVANKKELFFVMNGDWIDGTGLSLNGHVQYLTPLLEKMPWDVINFGNHELYKDNVISSILQPGGFVEWFGEKYVSSNIIRNDTQKPITGYRYRMLHGVHDPNLRVLTFAFIYDMKDASALVTVEEVDSVIHDAWFVNLVERQEYDAILILAHMGVIDPLVQLINGRIRELVGGKNVPIQFITGHTHYRRYQIVDEYSTSLESGKYLDTLGFVSFPTYSTVLENQARHLQQDLFTAATNSSFIINNATKGYDNTTANATKTTTLTHDTIDIDSGITTSNLNSNNKNTSADTGSDTVIGADSNAIGGGYNNTEKATNTSNIPPHPAAKNNSMHDEGKNATTENINATSSASNASINNSTGVSVALTSLFKYNFIDANKEVLLHTLASGTRVASAAGTTNAVQLQKKTVNGKEFSRFIMRVRNDLGLNEIVGCNPADPPHRFYLNHSLDDEYSLWRLYQQEIFPNAIFEVLPPSLPTPASPTAASNKHNETDTTLPNMIVHGQTPLPSSKENDESGNAIKTTINENLAMVSDRSSIRYDLIPGLRQGSAQLSTSHGQGQLRLDDIIAISPFNETIYSVGTNIPGNIILQLYNTLIDNYDNAIQTQLPMIPKYILSTNTHIYTDDNNGPKSYNVHNDSKISYRLLTQSFELSIVVDTLKQIIINTTKSTNGSKSANSSSSTINSFGLNSTNNGTATAATNASLINYVSYNDVVNTIIVDPHPTVNGTSTSLWASHVRQYWPCTNEENDVHQLHHNGSFSSSSTINYEGEKMNFPSDGSNYGNNGIGKSFSFTSNDSLTLLAAGIAISVVFILSGVYIWHRDTNYVNKVQKRHRYGHRGDELYNTMIGEGSGEAADGEREEHDFFADEQQEEDNEESDDNDDERNRFRKANMQSQFERAKWELI